MKIKRLLTITFFLLLIINAVFATNCNIKTLDPWGAELSGVLIIMISLEGKGETFRSLTNVQGCVDVKDVTSGLYRIIATCPHGMCITKIKELIIGDKDLNIEMKMGAINISISDEVIGQDYLFIKLMYNDRAPLSDSELIVRNIQSTRECCYETDKNGCATIGIIDNSFKLIVMDEDDSIEMELNIKELVLSNLGSISQCKDRLKMQIILPSK